MKCPSCGNTNCRLISQTTSKGFSSSKGCLGLICFGPLGILFGLFGMGTVNTDKFWLCEDCGNNFKYNEDYEELNLKINNSVLNLEFVLDLTSPKFDIKSDITKKLYNNFENFVNEITNNFKSRIINSMPDDNESLLRIKRLVWSCVGENKDFTKENENILFFIDDSIDLKGDYGLVLTTKAIYFSSTKIILDSIFKIELDVNNDIVINGISVGIKTLSNKDLNIFLNFLNLAFTNSNNILLEENFNSNIIISSNETTKNYVIKYKRDIYFCKHIEKNKNEIIKITYNNEYIKIYESESNIYLLGFNKDILYFYSGKGRKHRIFSIIKDSINELGIINEDIFSSKMFKQYILFNKSKISDNNLYVLNLDTSEKEILGEIFEPYCAVHNDWIYYINDKDKKSIYKIKIDGTSNIKVFEGDKDYIDNMAIYDNYIYFRKGNNLYSLINDIPTLIVQSKSTINFTLYNNYLIHSTKDPVIYINNETIEVKTFTNHSSVYITNLKSGKTELLTTESAQYLKVIDGIIYYDVNKKDHKFFDSDSGVNRCISINGSNQKSL